MMTSPAGRGAAVHTLTRALGGEAVLSLQRELGIPTIARSSADELTTLASSALPTLSIGAAGSANIQGEDQKKL